MMPDYLFSDQLQSPKFRLLFFLPAAVVILFWWRGWPIAAVASSFLLLYGFALFWVSGRLRAPSTGHHVHDLEVLYELTAALNGAADIEEVQTILLDTAVEKLGYPQAAVGLIDEDNNIMTGWLAYAQGQPQQRHSVHVAQMPISPTEQTEICLLKGSAIGGLPDWLQGTFGMASALCLPLVWGVHPVGILLLEAEAVPDETRQRTLNGLARQAAVTMGMMTTRLRRAKESAVQEERARIAMDIHDTVSQSLFGMVFTLNGAIKLLPEHPEKARPELERVLQTAEAVRQEIRQSIHDMWPHEFTAQQFERDLNHYARDMLQAVELPLTFDIRGNFTALSSPVRRTLYRICQESLTNIVHHAAATEARVCLDIYEESARLAVRDNGRGFEPAVALTQTRGPEHFGLHGMHERIRSLGGTCDIFSRPGAGTSIIIDLPVRGG